MKRSDGKAQPAPGDSEARLQARLDGLTPFRRMLAGIGGFVVVFLLAVLGYMLAGWGLGDAIYMVIITVFGVGYGEVHPVESVELRALTITVIIAGYGAVIFAVGGFIQMLIDGEFKKVLGARRMTKDIDQLEGHTILCGIGRMGTILARELEAADRPFVAIDADERHLQACADRGHLTVLGDATEEGTLEQAGIRRAAVLATVLSDDATNVFVTITARAMNPDLTIIARGENPRTESKLLGCGANTVVLPTAIGARRVSQLIIRPRAEDVLDQLSMSSGMADDLRRIGLHFEELEVGAEASLAGQPLSSIEVRSNHGFLIVGIRHADGSSVMNPTPDTELGAGDVLIVLGHDDDIPQLAAGLSSGRSQRTYRGVKIDA